MKVASAEMHSSPSKHIRDSRDNSGEKIQCDSVSCKKKHLNKSMCAPSEVPTSSSAWTSSTNIYTSGYVSIEYIGI